MGKLIIDTPDSTYYYCGRCAEKVSYNTRECNSCGHDLREKKSFRVPADFDPLSSILEQLEIFERAKKTNGKDSVATAKKLQINADGVSFFYCKNCRTAVSRTELQCPDCGALFSKTITVDSAEKTQDFGKNTPSVRDDWTPPPPNEIENPKIQTDFIPSSEDEYKDFQYVGFWARVGAYILDFIIIMIIASIFGIFIGLIVPESSGLFDSEGFFQLFGIALTWIYYAWWESSEKQATLGKMAIGAKVVDSDGNRIKFGKATARHFSKILSGIILGIGFLMVAFSKKKQGLHDQLADTYIIKR